jgi:hypothetical protein
LISVLFFALPLYQKVYYKAVDTGFPSKVHEALGYIVGISEHCFSLENLDS